MSGQSPPEPVKIPAGAADYTAATIDPELRSTLNALLLQEGYVRRYVGAARPPSRSPLRALELSPTSPDGILPYLCLTLRYKSSRYKK